MVGRDEFPSHGNDTLSEVLYTLGALKIFLINLWKYCIPLIRADLMIIVHNKKAKMR